LDGFEQHCGPGAEALPEAFDLCDQVGGIVEHREDRETSTYGVKNAVTRLGLENIGSKVGDYLCHVPPRGVPEYRHLSDKRRKMSAQIDRL
jgi:hypothetical protein